MLLKLEGSEKQIKWAEVLRQEWLDFIEKCETSNRINILNRKSDNIKETFDAIENCKSAKWFIDNRFETKARLVVRIANDNILHDYMRI